MQRAARRTRSLLVRAGEELRVARMLSGMSSREVASLSGVSHTYILRIERALAPHVDIAILARVAAVLGYELGLGIHPVGAPVRDKAHVALLGRFAARLHRSIRWQTEVPVPLPGDLRSADGVAAGFAFDAVVEAETRLDDVQAAVRKLRVKQRDLGAARAVLLIADSRHNRAIIDAVEDVRIQFPVGTRACLAAFGRGADPGGDCLVIM